MANAVQGDLTDAHQSAPLRAAPLRRFGIMFLALTLALTLIAIEATAASAMVVPQRGSEAARVVRAARSHIGARFRMGAEGQRYGRRAYFDCSGLVYRIYKETGLVRKIGGSRKVGTAYWRWFQRRGLANRKNPKPGDLIIWGKHGRAAHMGIVVGANRAISALVNPWGVRSHRITGLVDAQGTSRMRVLAYLHVRISR